MTCDIQIRPATPDDVKDIAHRTVRAIVAELDGKVIGVAGIMHTSPLQAFGYFEDEFKKYPKAVVKSIKNFHALLAQYDVPVYAIACPKQKSSSRFLEHAGFKFDSVEGDRRYYIWKR